LVNPVGFRVGFCNRDWFSIFSRSTNHVRRLALDVFFLRFLDYLFLRSSFFRYRGLFFSHFQLFHMVGRLRIAFYFYFSDFYKRRRLFSFSFILSVFRMNMLKFFGRPRRNRKLIGLKRFIAPTYYMSF